MAVLYGRAGRLTAKNGGFRPGQIRAAGQATVLTVAPAGETEPGATPLVADFMRLFETLAAKMRPPAVGAGEGRGHLLPWLGRQLWPGMAEQVARGSFPVSYTL